MPLNMKNIDTLPSEKNGSVDVTFARAITHQKHLAQSWGSMRSAVDIFSTLRVFPKDPIREQEIELEVYECHSKNLVTLKQVQELKTKLTTTTLTTNKTRISRFSAYAPQNVQRRPPLGNVKKCFGNLPFPIITNMQMRY